MSAKQTEGDTYNISDALLNLQHVTVLRLTNAYAHLDAYVKCHAWPDASTIFPRNSWNGERGYAAYAPAGSTTSATVSGEDISMPDVRQALREAQRFGSTW